METLEVMPVRVRITAILRKAIYSGEYKSGDELSLTDIAAQLGISRTPVRTSFRPLFLARIFSMACISLPPCRLLFAN